MFVGQEGEKALMHKTHGSNGLSTNGERGDLGLGLPGAYCNIISDELLQ